MEDLIIPNINFMLQMNIYSPFYSVELPSFEIATNSDGINKENTCFEKGSIKNKSYPMYVKPMNLNRLKRSCSWTE
jgi:hypothetical protein